MHISLRPPWNRLSLNWQLVEQLLYAFDNPPGREKMTALAAPTPPRARGERPSR
jgi:hypothetical protein